ncbi:uncharacterized protein CBL_14170 [Carabus blaptoides fortunei]
MFKLCILKLLLLLVYTNYVLSGSIINKNVYFKNVDRSIDLTSQLVKITSTVTIENSNKETVKDIVWSLDHGFTGKLSYISARDASKRDLRLQETTLADHDSDLFYTIIFNKPLEQKKYVVIIEEVYTGAQLPYPASITQKEKQLVRYFGNHYIYSPYLVNQQTTKVHVRTKNIESYTKLKPFTLNDGIITYGPYENIQPFTADKLSIHYENNSPFLTVTNLNRHIEVSHWGTIAIEESVSLLHTGATLKGSFSRYDYQRDNGNGLNSIKSFKTILPASAESPYYRDFNGNISTSNMRIKKDSVELDLRPRFPLFGGWKTCYTLGYSVPSYQYLFHKGDNYLLKIRLIDHVYDDMQVDQLETTIVLPVGATDIQLKTPYSVERLPDSVAYKYFDTKGRTVISFKRDNLVENHIQDLELRYQWSRVLMVHEPILLSIVLYVLFLAVIIYVRLDFSVNPNVDLKKQE